MEQLAEQTQSIWESLLTYLSSPAFYMQIVIVLAALLLAWALSTLLLTRLASLRDEPQPGAFYDMRARLYRARILVLPLMAAIVLGAAISFGTATIGVAWLIRVAQGVAFIILLFSLASYFIRNETVVLALKWIGVPLAILYVIGLLDDMRRKVHQWMDESNEMDVVS